MMMSGQIVRIISNLYTVKCNDIIYNCHARGKFRNDKITPLVGDYVKIQDDYIMSVEPRKNSLIRPPLANIDQVIVVTSVKNPDLSLLLLDKFLSIVEFNDITPVVCFTKRDLLDQLELEKLETIKSYYESIGYQVFYNDEVLKLKKILKDKLTVLAGQTGSGKSSLLNRIKPSLNLKTDEISKALGRGKHTTRHVELYEVEEGLVSDTPGFSSLELIDMEKLDIRDSFIEFANYPCKYRDCTHKNEDGCGVYQAVLDKEIMESRYENYLNFLEKK